MIESTTPGIQLGALGDEELLQKHPALNGVILETVSSRFSVKSGIRQGDPLFSKIFVAALEAIISQLKWIRQGFGIENNYLGHLRVADDLVLLSERESEL
ncbi:hypothetical protein EVAR_62199_1 [Eumeta japonica]|uniref:Reverse transcriptase domain-containing protein n=1 Tax=Eumeta variegata TaxID=151549 RepID=A0A4C2A405_EUMVA|nr:hypothetical protein EVAR_62199_1 [Eumeta japonica]